MAPSNPNKMWKKRYLIPLWVVQLIVLAIYFVLSIVGMSAAENLDDYLDSETPSGWNRSEYSDDVVYVFSSSLRQQSTSTFTNKCYVLQHDLPHNLRHNPRLLRPLPPPYLHRNHPRRHAQAQTDLLPRLRGSQVPALGDLLHHRVHRVRERRAWVRVGYFPVAGADGGDVVAGCVWECEGASG
jgi:hypothetical protein